LGRNVFLTGNHLRRRIARRAASGLQQLPVPVRIAETEVDYLYMPVLVKQQILRLKVSVDNIHPMNFLHTFDYLPEEAACFLLWNAHTSDNVIEQFTACCVLHNQVQLPGGLYNFVQLHHVAVADQLQYVNLPSDALDICNVYDSFFL
jgi:hypothetical protein